MAGQSVGAEACLVHFQHIPEKSPHLAHKKPSVVTVLSATWSLSCILHAQELPGAGRLCVWHALQLFSIWNLYCMSEAFFNTAVNNST